MFRELFDLPAHVLIVHATVVFIPLAALAAVLYAVWPALRKHIWWAVLGLGVLAPLTAWVARLSGQEFRQYMVEKNFDSDLIMEVDRHQSFGNATSWWSIGLGVAMLGLVLYVMPRSGSPERPFVVRVAAIVVTVALAAVTVYYVIRTGDSGANAVHSEI